MKHNPTEHKMQVALMAYLRIAGRQDLHWFAVPNGGHRHIAEANRLKAEGVRPGTPDLCFMLPEGKVAWLEMKTTKGTLGPSQKTFREIANRLGHLWGMARSVDEAIALLKQWGVLRVACQPSNNLFSTSHLETIKLKPKEQRSGTHT